MKHGAHHRRLRAGGAARRLGRGDGGNPGADPTRGRRLHLVALPTSSLQADLLIGAGCVESIETSAVSLGEFGPAPRFTARMAGAIRSGQPARRPRRVQAAEKGVPFSAAARLIGSDLLVHRPDWKVVDNRSMTTIRSCAPAMSRTWRSFRSAR
jgi:hypothetical protein